MKRAYLDYAASAPLLPVAIDVINQFSAEMITGNPSSVHWHGRKARALLDQAHTTIAAVFGVHPTEVILTSGATESNALALLGAVRAWKKEHLGKPHIVMTAIEHASVRNLFDANEVDLTLVKPNAEGVVAVADMMSAINERTAIVSCIYVNNEIGTVQPVGELGRRLAEFKQVKQNRWPVFHTDAVQAFPHQNTHIDHLNADCVTLSGHKYGALSGVGVLLIRKATPIAPMIRGGGQEWNMRAGTENLLGAMTLAASIGWHDEHRQANQEKMNELRHYLETSLAKVVPKARILGANDARVSHISYIWLPEAIENLVPKIDLAGVSVSSGSACSSGATLPSATLLALGFSHKEAYGGIRVSFGVGSTKADIDELIAVLVES